MPMLRRSERFALLCKYADTQGGLELSPQTSQSQMAQDRFIIIFKNSFTDPNPNV